MLCSIGLAPPDGFQEPYRRHTGSGAASGLVDRVSRQWVMGPGRSDEPAGEESST